MLRKGVDRVSARHVKDDMLSEKRQMEIISKVRRAANTWAVYVVAPSSGRPAKIGWSKDPSRRVRELNAGHWREFLSVHHQMICLEDCRELEKAVHKRLKGEGKHMVREWFDVDSDYAFQTIKDCFNELFGEQTNKEKTIEWYTSRPDVLNKLGVGRMCIRRGEY